MKWFKAYRQGSINEERDGLEGPQEFNPESSLEDLDDSWGPSHDGITSDLRILAEVNVLCTSDQTIQWVPLLDNLIAIKVTYQQNPTTGATVICLGTDGSCGGTSLDLQISLSESKLKKASECFVRWKDVQSGKVWGLNFLSEEEAFEFMAFCEEFSGNYSSGASSKSLNRKSTSSLNSSLNQAGETHSKHTKDLQHSSKRFSGQQQQCMNETGAVFENSSESAKLEANAEFVDSGVGDDEVDVRNAQDDLNFTEFSYYKEMEIFHTAINEKADPRHLDRFHTEGYDVNREGDLSCSGGFRRSGWLSMKHILICGRHGRLEQASHRKWRNYWVILKGYELNLYQCDEKDVGSIDVYSPNIIIKLEGCLAQPVPEHVKLENIFGLSTQNGDAYYFQGSSQSEVEGWIASIHSASAVQFAGGRGKEQTRWLLNKELEKMQGSIQSDYKLKKMAELQLTIVTESKNKQVITDQISEWEENLEKLNLNVCKLQCYLSAVGGSSPPNPQHVLACASKHTKQNMSRLGVFSVTSFHSLVHCREKLRREGHRTKRSKSSVGYSRLKSALMSSLKITDSSTARNIREHHSPKLARKETSADSDHSDNCSLVSDISDWRLMGNFVRVELASHGSTVVPLKEDMTFIDVVCAVANKRQLDPDMYFITFGVERESQIEYYTPQEQAFIEDQNYSVLKLCRKSEYEIEMSKTNDDSDLYFGLSVKLESNHVVVSHVQDGSASHLSGVLEGDEVLFVNNNEITEPENGLREVMNALTESFISLKLRSLREEVPEQVRKTTENIISTLVCPPPPKTSASDYIDLSELIVPPPELGDTNNLEEPRTYPSVVGENGVSVNVLLQSAEEVTSFCRQHDSWNEIEKPTELSGAEKLRKIIFELLDTEKNYLKDVQTLLKRYLEPLKHESFLPTGEVNSLVENVSQIIEFQTSFCSEIQQLIDCEEDFKNIKEIGLFQNVIYGIGEAFLQYADKFKLYSSFCVTHSRVIHMLHPGSNVALEEFLDARNPKQQHSSKLESYLIKPIQRILKYPLLLDGMSKLLDKNSEEYHCLNEAISAIEHVAEHINEMQSITEQFLQIFQELARESGSLEVSDVDVDKLLHHKKLTWLNSPETVKANSLRWSPAPLRKMKCESSMRCFVFSKAVILVQLEKRHKKKDKTSKGSLKVSEEINFKTLIPMSSLTLRDNSWSDQDLLYAWELVDVSKTGSDCGQQEALYLLSSRNADERQETVKKIKDAIRKSMIEDSGNLSRRKPSTASLLSTSSIHLRFPGEPAYFRRSFSHEQGRLKNKSLGRLFSAGEAEMYSASKNKR